MSYKAFGKLKERCEIEVLKEMSLTEINELLNGARDKILSLEKELRAARQNTKESPPTNITS